MRRTIQPVLLIILILASTAIAALSQEAEKINSANASVQTPNAQSGGKATSADECNEMLLKTLDALEKAEKAIGFLQMEIDARKRLESLNTELFKVKDLIIAEQQKLIELMRNEKKGSKVWRVLKKIASYAEKLLLLYIGVQAGRGL